MTTIAIGSQISRRVVGKRLDRLQDSCLIFRAREIHRAVDGLIPFSRKSRAGVASRYFLEATPAFFMPQAGVEPATSALGEPRSIL
jgi:hypothetical protein